MLLNTQTIISDLKSSPFRGALSSSGVMAFAGLGDALLYPILPIYGAELGLSVFLIGVLLSVNRFVRIFTNTPIANMVYQIGMKRVLIISSSLAVITTFFYGFSLGFISFFIARILWGLSYSSLKIATLNYAAMVENKSGLAFGLSKSIKSLGGLFILWFGPIIIGVLGYEKGIFIVGLISTIGILLAFSLPSYNSEKITKKVKTKVTFYPSAINLLVFILSITIDGILVVTLSYLLKSDYSDATQLVTAVAFYLLLKRLFALIFSFISGFLTLKIPTIQLFNFSIILCVVALLLISWGYVILGIIIAFLFNTVIVTFAPLIAIEYQKKNKNTLQAISSISTWWDLGAAIGAFLGIILLENITMSTLFLILSLFIIVLFINFIIKNAKSDRTTI